jgi:hypothetical protein
MLLVNENIPDFDQAGSFAIVGTAGDVVEGTAEAGFEKKKCILRRCNMAIESR